MAENDQLAHFNPTPLGPGDTRDRRLPVPRNIDIGEIDAFGQFRSLWDLLMKHQWLILSVTVVLTTLVGFYSLRCSRFTKLRLEWMWSRKRPCSKP